MGCPCCTVSVFAQGQHLSAPPPLYPLPSDVRCIDDGTRAFRPLVSQLHYASKRLLLHTCVSHEFRVRLSEAVLQTSRDFGGQLVKTDAKPAAASGAQLTQAALENYYFWLIPAIDAGDSDEETPDADGSRGSAGSGRGVNGKGKQKGAGNGAGSTSTSKSKAAAAADAAAAALKRVNKKDPLGETSLYVCLLKTNIEFSMKGCTCCNYSITSRCCRAQCSLKWAAFFSCDANMCPSDDTARIKGTRKQSKARLPKYASSWHKKQPRTRNAMLASRR